MPVLVDVGERVSVEVKGKPIRVGTVRYIGDTYCQVCFSKIIFIARNLDWC